MKITVDFLATPSPPPPPPPHCGWTPGFRTHGGACLRITFICVWVGSTFPPWPGEADPPAFLPGRGLNRCSSSTHLYSRRGRSRCTDRIREESETKNVHTWDIALHSSIMGRIVSQDFSLVQPPRHLICNLRYVSGFLILQEFRTIIMTEEFLA